MKYIVSLLLISNYVAAMDVMSNKDLGEVSGQAGLSIDLEMKVDISKYSYIDDGNAITLENLGFLGRGNTAGSSTHQLDILSDGRIHIVSDGQDNRIAIGGITQGASKSMGQFALDFDYTQDLYFSPTSANWHFDQTLNMTDGRFMYRTNGREVMFDNVELQWVTDSLTLDVVDGAEPYLNIDMPSVVANLKVGDIRVSTDASNVFGYNGVTDIGSTLASMGGLELNFELNQDVRIYPGGDTGNGMKVNWTSAFSNAYGIYKDDGHQFKLNNLMYLLNIQGMTLDVEADGLNYRLPSVLGNLWIGSVTTGDVEKAYGALQMDYQFTDNGADINQIKFSPGGHVDAGDEGLSIASQWNLTQANIGYTDDFNQIWLTGITSKGSGTTQINVTSSADTLGGQAAYDGVRIGLNSTGSYSIDALRTGSKTAPVQGGIELVSFAVPQAMDFELDGHVTIGAGGKYGSQGVAINADLVFDNSASGYLLQSGSGIWATGINKEIHLRNQTIDLDATGLVLAVDEFYGRELITDVRIGDKTGPSLGGLEVHNYYQDETHYIPGGADGVQGVSIQSTRIYNAADGSTYTDNQSVTQNKENKLVWTTNGQRLEFRDFSTNDAGSTANTYGLKNDLTIDVTENFGEYGFLVQARTRFQELNLRGVGSATTTMVNAVKLANFDFSTNLTATPVP